MADHEQPIIIKKVKKGGHGGHHGGAWKVAYADFVTAMMAFFLVMWILGLSPTQKNRIASFFREPGIFDNTSGKKLPSPLDLVAGSKGNEGNGAGDVGMAASNEDLDSKFNNSHAQAVLSDSVKRELKEEARKDSITLAEKIADTAEQLRQEMQEMKNLHPEIKDLLENIKVTISDEGLRVELVEVQDNEFFEVGSSALKPGAVRILKNLAGSLGKLQNHVVLEGHTDSKQYPGSRRGYSNWELSSDRANAARRVLESNGLYPDQIINVVACADKHPYNSTNPFDPTNRRVSIVVPNVEAAELLQQKIVDKVSSTGANGKQQEKSSHSTITGSTHH